MNCYLTRHSFVPPHCLSADNVILISGEVVTFTDINGAFKRWIEARFATRGFDLILSHCALPKRRLRSPPRRRFNQLSFCWLKQLWDLGVTPGANDPEVANDKPQALSPACGERPSKHRATQKHTSPKKHSRDENDH